MPVSDSPITSGVAEIIFDLRQGRDRLDYCCSALYHGYIICRCRSGGHGKKPERESLYLFMGFFEPGIFSFSGGCEPLH